MRVGDRGGAGELRAGPRGLGGRASVRRPMPGLRVRRTAQTDDGRHQRPMARARDAPR